MNNKKAQPSKDIQPASAFSKPSFNDNFAGLNVLPLDFVFVSRKEAEWPSG